MAEGPRRILAVTGSRADWGFLSVPLELLRGDPAFDVSLVATGQHLEPHSGGSLDAIRKEGFHIDAHVDMDLVDDSEQAVTRSMGIGLAGMGDAISSLRPDLMLLLGDRYEILAAGCAALLARCPIAHLAGGDISEGAVDDAIRHALTKLSHLHFPTNRDAARRIMQMGESPDRVHCVGSTGLDRLLKAAPMDRAAFFRSVGFEARSHNVLVTIHPVTLAADPLSDAEAVLSALSQLDDDFGILLTGTNADAGGKKINEMLAHFASQRPNAVFHTSLGSERYANALRHCDIVVGNSSSGLYEAPSLKRPAVNIGLRQDGRLRAASVIDCPGEPKAILEALQLGLELDCSDVANPYGDGHASERIVAILKGIVDNRGLLRKTFHLQRP